MMRGEEMEGVFCFALLCFAYGDDCGSGVCAAEGLLWGGMG